jgi:membrane protease YdiL (CAAX protease family)
MNFKNFTQNYPASAYFIITFTISWLGAFILIAPKLFNNQAISTTDGILMFPVMIVGPVCACIILTKMSEGKTGIRNLLSRMSKWKVPVKWYLIALITPPLLILITLIFLKSWVSSAYTPNFFAFGFLFGIPAGFLEEIGWTGYAFPKMRLKHNFINSSVLLGFIWGLWHLPVIDFLGAASPHGKYLIFFAVSFIAAMAAIRVIISWIYSKTNSIILAQFMHMVSTSSLVIFGPKLVSAAQESLWYMLYAGLLWITVLILSYFERQKAFAQQEV